MPLEKFWSSRRTISADQTIPDVDFQPHKTFDQEQVAETRDKLVLSLGVLQIQKAAQELFSRIKNGSLSATVIKDKDNDRT